MVKNALKLIFLALLFVLVFPADLNAATSYRANQASTITVNEWSECRLVTNQAAAKDTFVPTNTALEWSEFRIHYPSHISLAACSLSLSVSKAGTGAGTVTSSPAGINCGAACSANFAAGATITLTAVPNASSTFSGWSGGGCSGTGICTVMLSSNTTVTATFNIITYALSVSKAGTGAGTVTSSPAGINCGAACSANYSSGASVTLTAAADVGSAFVGWSGAGCSGTGTCTVTMSANETVTATFNVANYTLTVTKSGLGAGTVTSSPAGINCGAACNSIFGGGTSVTLTATPNASSKFAGWSGGGCSGTGTCTVALNADTAIDAKFNPATCTVVPGGGKRVFVTSATYKGASVRTNAAANTLCQNLASAAGLSGTYKAMIYLNAATPDTIIPAGKPIYNGGLTLNGCEWNLVGNDRTDMFNCDNCQPAVADGFEPYLRNPIKYDETGTERSYSVWTNIKPWNGSWDISLVQLLYNSTAACNHTPDRLFSCCSYATCLPCMTHIDIVPAKNGPSIDCTKTSTWDYFIRNSDGSVKSLVVAGDSQSATQRWSGDAQTGKTYFMGTGYTLASGCARAIDKTYSICDNMNMGLYCFQQ
ncbi:MAG TPA: hypothetical protein P5080_04840 [Candidatus Paceibacterota bacterium]|nr:hypothetical protein [Candidatus Pacearchaeota archaeon]HRZ51278.1 hypothetical protein [Candidatus Paceibacterota bacterium]HSA37000.1 hypothetical protein [Candidatus Paceibacterota bacterium]